MSSEVRVLEDALRKALEGILGYPDPREAAVAYLVAQGADRDWAEAHVEDACFEGDQLKYTFRCDTPVTRLVADFSLDGAMVGA